MDQDPPTGIASLGAFLAFVGCVAGSILLVLGGISFGFQLVAMPVGLALILLGAMRREPRLALAFFGGSIGIAIASWLSYSFGLAPTIFMPNGPLLLGTVSLLASLGYLAGRLIEAR